MHVGRVTRSSPGNVPCSSNTSVPLSFCSLCGYSGFFVVVEMSDTVAAHAHAAGLDEALHSAVAQGG